MNEIEMRQKIDNLVGKLESQVRYFESREKTLTRDEHDLWARCCDMIKKAQITDPDLYPMVLQKFENVWMEFCSDEDFAEMVKTFIDQMRTEAQARGYKRGWVWYQIKDRFGFDVANEFCPK